MEEFSEIMPVPELEPEGKRVQVPVNTIYETSSFNSSMTSSRSSTLDLSHSSKMRLVPSIEDFVIVKNISSGAFGKVVLARHRTKTEQIYAVKVMEKVHMLNKNMAERINNEKNALAISHSDFVVKIFYSLQSRSRIYLVMEYMIGGDLKNLLQRMIAFPESAARFYIAECALALEYLHKHGIIHRDIKPDNVLIGVDGHVKLTDFGLCNFDRENVEIGDIIATPMNLQKTKTFRGRTPGQLLSLTTDIRLTPDMKHHQKPAETKLELQDASVSQMLNSGLRKIHISPPAADETSLPRAPMTPLTDITNFRETPKVGHSRTAFTTMPRKARRSAGYKRQSFEFNVKENPDGGLRKRPKRENRPKRLSFKLVEDSPQVGEVDDDRGGDVMERDGSSRVCMFDLSVGDCVSLSPPRASTPQPGYLVEKETCMPNFELKGSECASMSRCENLSAMVRERHAPLDKLKELKQARQMSVVAIPPRIDEHSVSMSNAFTPETRHRVCLMSKALTEYRPRKKRNHIKSAGQSGILGTPDYLAPEILRKKNHTTAVDIWSLGVCLYEFLIGCPPFIDETVERVFSNILARAIDYPEGEESLSHAAVETIESLLETEVNLRPSAVSLRNLPLFRDVDFSKIHQQKAPWIPTTSSDIDTACFDGGRAQFDVALSSL